MAVHPRTPCVIGVAQRTWHLSGDDWAPEPLEMQAEVLSAAAEDTGASRVLASLDGLDVVHCMSWPYDEPARRLAGRVAADPERCLDAGMGGTVPQQLLNAAARRIIAGESGVEAVVGAEALDTKRRMKKAGERPAWSHRHPDPPGFPFEAPFHPAEIAHEVFQAWLTFAVRDIARRARTTRSPEEHREELGRLLAPFSEVAAKNPYAWFPTVHTAEELITPTPANRMVGYPYTKTMVAVMDVDMAAAVILASWEEADRLGVPVERRVPLAGWCFGTDQVYLAEHPDLSRSPAMAVTSAEAMRVASVALDDIAHFDLYSCFASSVDFARDALGIAAEDSRCLTVTGGLPYAGGPASNYLGHAIATMVRTLREDPGALGLVSGVGMHMTKHVYAVYGGVAGASAPRLPAETEAQRALEVASTPRLIAETATGPATIAAYSVVHGRDGEPQWGLAVLDLPDGARTYARSEDLPTLARWEAQECVGEAVELRTDGTVNHVAN